MPLLYFQNHLKRKPTNIFKKSILIKKIKIEFVFEVIQNCLETIPNSFCIVVVVDFSNLIKGISYNLCYVISKMLILVRNRFLCL